MTYHVGLSGSQALYSEMQSNQTTRAGCVDCHTGSLEVEEPADSVGEGGICYTGWLVFNRSFWVRVENSKVFVVKAAHKDGRIGP